MTRDTQSFPARKLQFSGDDAGEGTGLVILHDVGDLSTLSLGAPCASCIAIHQDCANALHATLDGFHQVRYETGHLVGLAALRLFLDEVTSLPEGAAFLSEMLGLQTQLVLDDGAHHQATVGRVTAQDAPHVLDIHGRSIVQTEECGRKVEVADLAVLNVTNA